MLDGMSPLTGVGNRLGSSTTDGIEPRLLSNGDGSSNKSITYKESGCRNTKKLTGAWFRTAVPRDVPTPNPLHH